MKKSERTKLRILQKSKQLFLSEGSCQVSTNKIAQSLDMSPGNLYYHYNNKEAIASALIERSCQSFYDVTYQGDHKSFDASISALLTIVWQERYMFEVAAESSRQQGQANKHFCDLHDQVTSWLASQFKTASTEACAIAREAKAKTLWQTMVVWPEWVRMTVGRVSYQSDTPGYTSITMIENMLGAILGQPFMIHRDTVSLYLKPEIQAHGSTVECGPARYPGLVTS